MIKFFNRKNKNNKGFGLIEVLISVAIMSIVTLPLAQSFVTSSQVNKKSEVKLSAITVAENRMEQAKAIDLSMYEKAEDGKYYISEDAVDENGNTFNVQTIIDPTKYDSTINRVYDLSTFSPTTKCEFYLPEDAIADISNKYTFTIDINITEERKNDLVEQYVTYTFTRYIKNKFDSEESGILFTYIGEEYDSEGNKLGLKNMNINYLEIVNGKKWLKLNRINIFNPNNVGVVINYYKLNGHDNGNDDLYVYEGKHSNDIPYTLIGDHPKFRTNNYYRDGKKKNYHDNVFFNGTIDSEEYSIDYLEVMHAVEVSVYEYVDSDDESVKYDDGLLLTKLEGSKIVDY
jgi:prepilin-type N-terminal cleavage/methylation domain-containing protein